MPMSRMPNDNNIDPNFDPAAQLQTDDGRDPSSAPQEGVSVEEYDRLKADRDSLFERLARAQADFQNSRKRLEAEADQRLSYANANLIKSLLPVIDNLERAVAVDPASGPASIIKGIQVVMDQFNKVLNSQHVEAIAPQVGEPFDPTRHEALMQQPSNLPPNHVTQLLQKGYRLHDRTLRPAQVAVSKPG
jgi:molecular chaperone GrpE